MKINDRYNTAAYGGKDWDPRIKTHKEEIGNLWTDCGLDSEWNRLKSVLVHPPGEELFKVQDPNSIQMLGVPDLRTAKRQHDAIVAAFIDFGISVHHVAPKGKPSPNLIYCADLFFMTPEGAILARPASNVRAGEEIWIARRLSDMGIPILKTLRGGATFEGADALWLNQSHVLIGRGLRTNDAAITQVSKTLNELDVHVTPVDLPVGSMHLMGILRFLDKDLVLAWPNRLAWKAVEALRAAGYQVMYIPDELESIQSGALNFVTLGARQILMAAGNPKTQSFLEANGIHCRTVVVDEILKGAGGIGCLTGIIERDLAFID